MTFREEIISLIVGALTPDEANIQPQVLDTNNETIFAALDLGSKAERLFTEEAVEYIAEVRALLENLPPSLPVASIFPQATNLAVFLDLANLIDLDDLDEPLPSEIDQLAITEAPDVEAFERDDSRVHLFAIDHLGGLLESVAFLDMSTGFRFAPGTVPKTMTACATILVGRNPQDMQSGRWIISAIPDEQQRKSYVRYHMILKGKRLANSVPATASNALDGIADTLNTSHEYIQFAEPFEMLGESNGRLTVLDSVMSLYHVIENYMIRAQIAKVANGNTSALFGIRHFKQLEIAVERRELDHLTQLFKASWDINIGGWTLSHYVDARFSALFSNPHFQEQAFQAFLQRLTVKKMGEALNVNDPAALRSSLAKIIYQVRCSIVHNKETEFHLSNRELSADPVGLLTLTELCIPCMQRLAFGLPAAPASNPLRYNHSALQLY